LAWAAEYLEQWYRIPKPALDADQHSVAASVLTLLKGDAGQRAIVAQSLGWAPAQQVSGSGWMAPYLALMQQDAYDAVRHIATRSRATLPPFRRDALPRNRKELLLNADGTFDAETVNRLVRARDNRRVAVSRIVIRPAGRARKRETRKQTIFRAVCGFRGNQRPRCDNRRVPSSFRHLRVFVRDRGGTYHVAYGPPDVSCRHRCRTRGLAEVADDQLKPSAVGSENGACCSVTRRIATLKGRATNRTANGSPHEAVARPFSASARDETAQATADAPKREGREGGRAAMAEHRRTTRIIALTPSGSVCMNCHNAVHHVRPAEDHPQPPDQQPVGHGDARHRTAKRVQPLSPRPDAGVGRRVPRTVVSNPKPALDADQQFGGGVGATLLKGDAGQRAIVAQSLGWAPAQQVSGTGWMAPYLALVQQDAYDAVRHIANRSRATLPPFKRDALPRNRKELLLNADGTFDAETVDRLVRRAR
jgi:hypothetical protein